MPREFFYKRILQVFIWKFQIIGDLFVLSYSSSERFLLFLYFSINFPFIYLLIYIVSFFNELTTRNVSV